MHSFTSMNVVRRRALALLAIITALVFFVAGPAFAHVELASSDPTEGSRLATAPGSIRLEFSTASVPAGDGLILYDQTGTEVEVTITASSETVMLITPSETLTSGQYLVSWTMRAGDAHPKSGSVGFSVAATAAPTAVVDTTTPVDPAAAVVEADPEPDETMPAVFESLAQQPSTAVADWIGRIARMMSIAAVLLGLGAFLFGALVFEGSRREALMVGYWARRAGAVILLAVPFEIISQAMLLGGGSIGSAFSPGLLAQAAGGMFGFAMVLRVAGGIGLFLGTRLVTSWSEPEGDGQSIELPGSPPPSGGVATVVKPVNERFHVIASPIAIVGAITVALSFLFDGHTAVTAPSWLVRFASVVHVVAAATWVGGVAMLAALFTGRRNRGEPLDVARLVIPFSTVAAAAVVLAGLAGGVLALSIVDSFGDFFTTAWGRTLLLKLGLVGAAGAIGGYNHQVLIPLLKLEGDDGRAADDISRTVVFEIGILLGVAAVTAVLVALAS